MGIIRPSRACSYARAYEKLHAYGGLHADVCGDAWCTCSTREVRGEYTHEVHDFKCVTALTRLLDENVKNPAFL